LPTWTLLAAYLVLLATTGYIAFLRSPYTDAADPDILEKAGSIPEYARPIFEAGLKDLADNHRKSRELALQSFNVVLGAVLGFLSAVYTTSHTRRRGPKPSDLQATTSAEVPGITSP
jgi:hypothetical protein